MRKYPLLLLLLTAIFMCGTTMIQASEQKQEQEQTKTISYPSYKTVATHFFDNYHFKEDLSFINFAKKPEGWAVQVKDKEGGVQKEYLVWSRKAKQYLKVALDAAEGEAQKEAFFNRHFWGTYGYERCPYYGYNGWSRDVIRHFGKLPQTEMSDTLLEGLGRAYSHYAESYVRDQWGNQKNKERNKNYGYEPMDADDFKPFLQYTHLALKTYKRLEKQNPDYETIVGNSKTKWSNSNMNTYFLLHSVRAYKEAKAFIPSNLYEPFMLDFARNTLQTCAPHAILFTQGDNDTYPLWYVQKIENFRPDVIVINLSLLAADWYNIMVRQDQFYPNKVQGMVGLEQIMDKNREASYLKKCDANANSMDLKEWVAYVSDNTKAIEKEGVLTGQFTTRKLTWKVNKQALQKQDFLTKEQQKNLPEYIDWALPNTYLLKNHLMMLDILATNDWQRPVYFAQSVDFNAFLGLKRYTQQEGLAARLVPFIVPNSDLSHKAISVAIDLMKENLLGKFTIDQRQSIQNSDTYDRIGRNYRWSYFCLAEELIAQDALFKAEAVLDKCETLLPANFLPYSLYNNGMVEVYYQLDAPEKAATIATSILETTMADLEKTKTKQTTDLRKRLKDFIKRVQKQASDEGQKEFVKTLKQYASQLK